MVREIEEIMNESYDRNRFIKFYKPIKDVNDALQDLKDKGDYDPDAISDLGRILHGDSAHYVNLSPVIAKSEAKKHLEQRLDQLPGKINSKGKIEEGYITRNIEEFFKKLEAGELYKIALQSQPCKNGGSEHDKKVETVIRVKNELENMQKIGEEKNIYAKVDYIKNYYSQKKGTEWFLESFMEHGRGDESYVDQVFNDIAGEMQAELQDVFSSKGKLDRGCIEEYIKNNLDAIKKEANRETDLGDKSDLYDLIKPTYLEIARTVYRKEKKEREKEEDPAAESRKKRRAGLGLPL